MPWRISIESKKIFVNIWCQKQIKFCHVWKAFIFLFFFLPLFIFFFNLKQEVGINYAEKCYQIKFSNYRRREIYASWLIIFDSFLFYLFCHCHFEIFDYSQWAKVNIKLQNWRCQQAFSACKKNRKEKQNKITLFLLSASAFKIY